MGGHPPSVPDVLSPRKGGAEGGGTKPTRRRESCGHESLRCPEISAHLKRKQLAAQTAQVKTRHGGFKTLTRQMAVEEPADRGRGHLPPGLPAFGRGKTGFAAAAAAGVGGKQPGLARRGGSLRCGKKGFWMKPGRGCSFKRPLALAGERNDYVSGGSR